MELFIFGKVIHANEPNVERKKEDSPLFDLDVDDSTSASVNSLNEEATSSGQKNPITGSPNEQSTGCFSLPSSSNSYVQKRTGRRMGTRSKKGRTFYKYELMTYAELDERAPYLAKRAFKLYYKSHAKSRVHLCGLCLDDECDFMSDISNVVRYHTKKQHPQFYSVTVYKIIDYPPKKVSTLLSPLL